MVDPGGEDEDVRALSMGVEHVGDDLVEAILVGDERAVDFGHPAGRGGIGVAGVAEPGWVDVEDRVRYWRIGCRGR